jgi:hypothetical protein
MDEAAGKESEPRSNGVGSFGLALLGATVVCVVGMALVIGMTLVIQGPLPTFCLVALFAGGMRARWQEMCLEQVLGGWWLARFRGSQWWLHGSATSCHRYISAGFDRARCAQHQVAIVAFRSDVPG